MEKLDLTKLYKTYYKAKTVPELVELEAARYLAIAGKGNPDGPEFAARTQTLYAVGYRIKFMCKALKKDFTVAKLEGQWWFDETKWGVPSLQDAPRRIPRSEWEYRLLIRLPEYVAREQVKEALWQTAAENESPYLQTVELFETPKETAVQILHVGPFHREPESLERLQEFMDTNGLERAGLHHEIYLSDFRKTLAEKLKTILREPVRRI